jgi:surfeit locus 1 family protein
MNARQGFFVVTPLLLAPGDAVLVQRGWMPRDFSDRLKLQPLPAQPGTVLVSGRLAPPPAKLFEMGGAGQGAIRQNLDLAQLSRDLGLVLRPLSVQQLQPTRAAPGDGVGQPPPDDGLLRNWPAVAVDVGKHHGYAFQWFSLSALLIGLTLWFQFILPWRRARQPGPAPDQPCA